MAVTKFDSIICEVPNHSRFKQLRLYQVIIMNSSLLGGKSAVPLVAGTALHRHHFVMIAFLQYNQFFIADTELLTIDNHETQIFSNIADSRFHSYYCFVPVNNTVHTSGMYGYTADSTNDSTEG